MSELFLDPHQFKVLQNKWGFEFQQTFNFPVMAIYDLNYLKNENGRVMGIIGWELDILKFEKRLRVPENVSIMQFILNKHGEDAVKMVEDILKNF
jgi:hypothetical protein